MNATRLSSIIHGIIALTIVAAVTVLLALHDLTGGQLTTDGPAVFVCRCGVWRHGYFRDETQLRALVESRMPTFIENWCDHGTNRRNH